MYVNNEERGRRTQAQRRAATRRALLDAGRGVFAEKGYHGATAEEIVGRAGVTRGALYHHFEGGKEGLFRAVVEEVQDEIDAAVLEVGRAVLRETGDLEGAVMASYRAYLEVCGRPDVERIVLRDGPAVLGWEEWHRIDAAHAVAGIEAGLKLLMDNGLMERYPVGPMARLLHGAILEAAMYAAVSEDPEKARGEAWESLRRLLKGLGRP